MYLLILSLLVAFTPLYDCDDSRKHSVDDLHDFAFMGGVPPTPPPHDDKRFGWEGLEWVSLEHALKNTHKRPTMLVFHRENSKASKNFKETIPKNRRMYVLSDFFWLVKLDADSEVPPDIEHIAPDGNYDVRVMFLDKEGKVDVDMKNDKRIALKLYYYPNVTELVRSMERTIVKGKHKRPRDEL